jgi:hypothetical protein
MSLVDVYLGLDASRLRSVRSARKALQRVSRDYHCGRARRSQVKEALRRLERLRGGLT